MSTPAVQMYMYALQEVHTTPTEASVIRGTLLFHSSCARVLFDMSISHSFVAMGLAWSLGLELECRESSMAVDTPLGFRVVLRFSCHCCSILISNNEI